MTRFIYDQFSKDYLETLLNDYGSGEVAKQVPAEIREIDFYFTPTTNNLPPQLGILAKLVATPSLFEPYRNPVTLKEIKDCLLKLLEINAQVQREATRNNSSLIDTDLPRLWIITPTASERILNEFGAKMQLGWDSGIYFLPNSLKTAIIVIHQLPVTRETLWLRLLGRGRVQAKAIAEFSALPDDYLFKSAILEVLYSLQKNLEANKDSGEREDRELMMRLAPLYQEEKAKARQEGFEQGILEGIREGEARGEARGIREGKAEGIREGEARGIREGKVSLILRLLNRKFGNLNPNATEQIRQLSLEKLETLAESLLDFNTQADLDNWLTDNLSS